jgi:rare lipoprotein A
MSVSSRCSGLALIAVAAVFGTPTFGLQTQAATPDLTPQEPQTPRVASKAKPQLDRSGKRRFGKASFYAGMFVGRKMANGNKMNPHNNSAASKTLPLGTTAKVTNLETGKSAVVTIEDRGPYVDGRIVDLTPAVAQQIGLSGRKGVTKVEVAPITVPQPDGSVKLGAAAGENLSLADALKLARYEKPSSRRMSSSGL